MQSYRVYVIGVGRVGRQVIRGLRQSRRIHGARFGVQFVVCGLFDSTGGVWADDGLPDDLVDSVLACKEDGRAVGEHAAGTKTSTLPMQSIGHRSVVVDTSASDVTGPILVEASNRGARVVMANKKPLTGSPTLFTVCG